MFRAERAAMCLVVLSLLLFSGQVFAQEYWFHERSIERENAAKHIAPLNVDTMFGDHHSMYDGSVTFNNVDISVPGNNALPVELRRSFPVANKHEMPWVNPGDSKVYRTQFSGFSDWDLDVPHLSGVFIKSLGWTTKGSDPNQRCTTTTPPRSPGIMPFGSPHTFWNGYNLHVPDKTSEKLLYTPHSSIPNPGNGVSYPWITKGMWRISCMPSTKNGHPGESFVATSPDGVKYFFDWVITRWAPDVVGLVMLGGGAAYESRFERSSIFFVVTRVEDRFGNWVNYQWSGDRLQQISSNDGRQINISYNSLGRIISASSGGRQWGYTYTQSKLSKVTLPDASTWLYSRPGFLESIEMEEIDDWVADCPSNEIGKVTFAGDMIVTHPSGAVAEFSFDGRRHHRSGTPFSCQKPATTYEYLDIPNYTDTFSLISKKVTGPGLATLQWDYTYSPGSGLWYKSYCDAGNLSMCPPSKIQTVSGPNNTWERYEYGIHYDVNEGQLLKKEAGSGPANILRTETYSYVSTSEVAGYPFPATVGTNPLTNSNPLAEVRLRPQKSVTVNQQGASFSKQVTSFDVFARPTSVTKSSTVP